MINIYDLRFVGRALEVALLRGAPGIGVAHDLPQFALPVFKSGGNRKRLVRIEEVELQIHWMALKRTVAGQALHSLNRLLAQVVAVLRFERIWLAVFLRNPAAG